MHWLRVVQLVPNPVISGKYGSWLPMHKECFPDQGWKVLGLIVNIMASYNAVLAGGTALALHIGHRESGDLDFFTTTPFRVDSVISDIRKTSQEFSIRSEGPEHVVALIDGCL